VTDLDNTTQAHAWKGDDAGVNAAEQRSRRGWQRRDEVRQQTMVSERPSKR